MREFTYVVTDTQGIHSRPAGLFVQEASRCKCSVTISKDGVEVDAKRILGVIKLGAKHGDEVTVRCEGPDEDAAIEKLSKYMQENM